MATTEKDRERKMRARAISAADLVSPSPWQRVHGHNVNWVPPTALPNRSVATRRHTVLQSAPERRVAIMSPAHEFPDPLIQPKVALETGRQRPSLPVNIIQISITLVDGVQCNVGLHYQPTTAANNGARKAPAPP